MPKQHKKNPERKKTSGKISFKPYPNSKIEYKSTSAHFNAFNRYVRKNRPYMSNYDLRHNWAKMHGASDEEAHEAADVKGTLDFKR